DQERAGRLLRRNVRRGQGLAGREVPKQRGADLVQALHHWVVGRRPWHPFHHCLDKLIFATRLEGIVEALLLTDRRLRRVTNLLSARRARRVTRIDDDVVRELTQAVDDRVVELLDQPLRLPRSEQIRPPDLPSKEDVAGIERNGIRACIRIDQ
ncbi:MAG: hypothetical protein K0R13_3180, partial [Propionibacteriaceae bacterium]|nr:hypothetical protein [Propionibacteriaceae bacterium]